MKTKEKKVPSVFKKPVSRAVWDKKYIGKIYLPEDRAFLESHLIKKGDELSISVEKMSIKDLKRLKELGKVIKANRKGVSVVMLIILAVLVMGVLSWQIFLKDAVVKRFVESRLEQVFLAQVDIGETDLSLLRGTLSIHNMVVANNQAPMTNLVEFESIKGKIDITRLLKGKILIEELGFSGLMRGTARTVSGALPEISSDTEAVEKTKKAKNTTDPVVPDIISETAGVISALIGEIDVEKILEQQKANLKSFGVIDNSTAKIEEWSDEFEVIAGDWQGRVSEWESTAGWVSGINPGSFSSIESAQSTLTELQGIYDRVGKDYGDIVLVVEDSGKKINEASTMMAEIQNAVNQDLEYVESLVSLPSEGGTDWAASIIEDQLGVPVLKYLDYFRRGTDFYERFKSVLSSRKSKTGESRRRGRSLVSANAGEPGFILQHAFASGEEEALIYQVDLYNLTDSATAEDGGPRLALEWDTVGTGVGNVEVGITGGSLSLSAMPFGLGESLVSLGIKDFSGSLSLDSTLEISEERVSGLIDLTADGIILTEAESDDFLYRIIQKSIKAVVPLSAGGLFSWSEADGLNLSTETELDEQLGDAVAAILEESAGEGVKLIKEYLELELKLPMKDVTAATDNLTEYVASIESYEDEIDSYQAMAEEKIAEIETEVSGAVEAEIRNQIENQIGEDTTKEIEKAADDIKKGLGGILGF
jgi:hypothetical protein